MPTLKAFTYATFNKIFLREPMKVIQGDGFTAEIIRSSKRKTSAIKIQKGQVYIMVPKGLSRVAIETLVINKSRWITEKLTHQQTILALPARTFSSGERYAYLGAEYVLTIITGVTPMIKLDQDRLIVSVRDQSTDSTAIIKVLLINWYKQQAVIALKLKTQRYAAVIGVQPTSMTIKTYKARWGSCSLSGAIQFNWKLMMAPDCIVDYVVVHELCHLLHHNHSPAFWAAVAHYCPDYRVHSAWLKRHGARLEI
jgi:predicted metal-dependent hydrolase